MYHYLLHHCHYTITTSVTNAITTVITWFYCALRPYHLCFWLLGNPGIRVAAILCKRCCREYMPTRPPGFCPRARVRHKDDAAHGRLRDLYKKWSKCFGAILAKTRIAWRTHSTGEFVFAPREEANILLSTFQLGFGRARGHVGASKPKVYCHYWHVRYRGTSLRLSVILPIATITKPIAERIQQGASRWFSIALRMAPSAVLAPPPNCLVGLAAWLVSRLAAWLLGCRGCAGCPDCTGCPGSPDHPIYIYIYIYIYTYIYIHIYIYIY